MMVGSVQKISNSSEDFTSVELLSIPNPTSPSTVDDVLDIFLTPSNWPVGSSLVYNMAIDSGAGFVTAIFGEWRGGAQKIILRDLGDSEVVLDVSLPSVRGKVTSFVAKFRNGTAKIYPANRKNGNGG